MELNMRTELLTPSEKGVIYTVIPRENLVITHCS